MTSHKAPDSGSAKHGWHPVNRNGHGTNNITPVDLTVEKVETYDGNQRHGTILSGYSVITKSMIGSGIFTIAYACSQFGIITALALLFLAALITWLSLKVLAKLALEYHEESPTFYSVSNKIMPKARWVVDVALIINCVGAAIVYVQSAGNLMSFAIISGINSGGSPGGLSQKSISMIVQAVMITSLAPLCMMKEITSTRFANFIGLSCLLYTTIVTFFYTDCRESGNRTLLYPVSPLIAMGSFPSFIFAFACQQNEFTVANELKNATPKRLSIVNLSATLTGLVVYLPMMLLPFLTFGRDIKSNYLYNLDTTSNAGSDESVSRLDIAIIIAFVAASLSVSISYVLQVQPVRRSVESLVFGNTKPTGSKERRFRISTVTVILLATFGLAVGLGDDLSVATNVSGLLGGNTMCFVMPFLLYLTKYGSRRDHTAAGEEKLNIRSILKSRNTFDLCVLATLVFCIALYPICLTGILYKAFAA